MLALKLVFGFLIFSVITATLSLPITINQVGDIKIQRDGDNIICDTLVCPTSATRCSIDKKSNYDREKIITTQKCMDRNGNVVLKSQQVKDNENPNESVNFHLDNGRQNIRTYESGPYKVTISDGLTQQHYETRQTISYNYN